MAEAVFVPYSSPRVNRRCNETRVRVRVRVRLRELIGDAMRLTKDGTKD